MATIATATSGPSVEQGQKNRSGPDFQFISNNGDTITINAPTGVTFNVMQDKTAWGDGNTVPAATNGRQVPGDTFKLGDKYYIANPEGATQNFTVTFTQ